MASDGDYVRMTVEAVNGVVKEYEKIQAFQVEFNKAQRIANAEPTKNNRDEVTKWADRIRKHMALFSASSSRALGMFNKLRIEQLNRDDYIAMTKFKDVMKAYNAGGN